MILMFLRNFWAWLHIFMMMCFTYILYTHLTYWFLMILFSWVWYVPYWFRVFSAMWFTFVSWKIFCFNPCLKDFVLVFQIFHITSCGILHMVEFSNIFYFRTYFWKPLPATGGWMGDHAHVCFHSENHFKLEHEWVVGYMRYTFDIIVFSIGIIGFFQLVSILTFLVYSYIFYICMHTLQIVSISIGINIFHTYIYFVYVKLEF